MFRSRAVHTIDAKGRLAIPTTFRTELQRRSERPPILTNLVDCLALYPYEDWLAIESDLAETSSVQPDVQALQRFLISGASDCPIDRQGRILIPPHLREWANLEREVTIAGVGVRIELWDRARFDQDIALTKTRYREISSVLDRLRT